MQFDQMMKLVEVLGMPPHKMLADAPKTSRFFDRLPDGSFAPKSPESSQVIIVTCVLNYSDY
jgi:dual specificity tyrosine-phosphorylation-regulated kinase 1